jgi:hypothetical protein
MEKVNPVLRLKCFEGKTFAGLRKGTTFSVA